MSSKAVIGLGFGDEGKGVTTEYLCAQKPEDTFVVRFSGGHQAGHKVIKDNKEHIFSSFGAGTLSGCPTYWSEQCTVEPVAFLNEFNTLLTKGVIPKIHINRHCPVTTIYDVFANRNSVEMKHGTTGSGFFKTLKRHGSGLRLTIENLRGMFDRPLKALFEEIRQYHKIEDDLDDEIFLNAVDTLRNMIHRGKITLTDDFVQLKENVVYEGSQGLMLDPHIGHMPHCTPSDITPNGIYSLGQVVDEVFLVTRSYQTRHGNGPMTNEYKPVMLKNNEKETNITNPWQGQFRTSVLDLDQLIHAKTKGIDGIVKSGTKVNLVVTCMDQLDEYKVTYGPDTISLTDGVNFAKLIADGLNIRGDVYINETPESNLKRI